MDVVALMPRLQLLRFAVGQAYLWQDDDALTLIDAGLAGSAGEIEAAIGGIGGTRRDLRQLVLTHFHDDHVGAAGEISRWGGVTVLAHHRDAPVIRGEQPGPAPVFTPAERELYERIAGPGLPPAPPCRVDRELREGDLLGFGGGARILSVPGHTDGSIAVHLPAERVLFTGDAVARASTQTILGPFNVDRDRAIVSMRRLAAMDVDVACFGHGDPLVGRAARHLATTRTELPA